MGIMMKLAMDRVSQARFRRRLRKRAEVIRNESQQLVRRTSHMGIKRGRELTKGAIEAQAAQGNFEFEAVLEEGKWSDIGTHSLTPSYKWTTKRIRRGGETFYQRFRRRKYPRHIKVFAEKTHKTSTGWASAIINRTKNILELDERTHIWDTLTKELKEYMADELKKFKKVIA